jgi:hypothetical protein
MADTRSRKQSAVGSNGELAGASQDLEARHQLLVSVPLVRIRVLTIELSGSKIQDLHVPFLGGSGRRRLLQAGFGQLYRRTRYIAMVMTLEQGRRRTVGDETTDISVES